MADSPGERPKMQTAGAAGRVPVSLRFGSIAPLVGCLAFSDDPLVAAAVEEQRLALSVVHVLDLAEEQGMVAAPVGPDDPSDKMSERTFDKRCVTHDLEPRLLDAARAATAEVVGEPRL